MIRGASKELKLLCRNTGVLVLNLSDGEPNSDFRLLYLIWILHQVKQVTELLGMLWLYLPQNNSKFNYYMKKLLEGIR